MIYKKYPKKYDTYCPDDRTNHVVEPEIFLCHSWTPSDKRYDGTSEIVKLSEDDIPESIFFDLSLEYTGLGLSYSEPVSIFCQKLFPEPFPDPVADVVSDHGSSYSRDDSRHQMISSPESSYEDHHIHPWDGCTDKGKWLDTCWEKCDQIVPVSEYFHEISDPGDRDLDPLRSYKWYDDESKSRECEKNRESFRESFEEVFQRLLHEITLAKKFPFAKKRSRIFLLEIDRI